MKINYVIIIFLFIFSNYVLCQKDDLSINFLPSTKYKMNTKDLSILKSDIERQVNKYYAYFLIIIISCYKEFMNYSQIGMKEKNYVYMQHPDHQLFHHIQFQLR